MEPNSFSSSTATPKVSAFVSFEPASLDRKMDSMGEKFDVEFSPEIVSSFVENVLLPITRAFIYYGEKFARFYTSRSLKITRNPSTYTNQHSVAFPVTDDSAKRLDIEDFISVIFNDFYFASGERAIFGISLDYLFTSFSRIPTKEISFVSSLEISFEDRISLIRNRDNELLLMKGYNAKLTDAEISRVISSFIKEHLAFIENDIPALAEAE